MNEVSFPGLGIGPFEINNVAFHVFGRDIMWYGILISVGMILAFFYARSKAKYEGIKTDDLLDLALFLIIFGVVGARLYFVIFNIGDYIATGGNFFQNLGRTLLNFISIWNGGLAIFGGIIAGFFTAMIVARKKKIRFPILLDVLAPSVMIGQILGRWGNFFNCEAYGSETALPWRMGIKFVRANGLYNTYTEVHPTFLYESLWNLIGFILISVFYKKKKFNGQIFYFYMIWYGFGRFFIEGLRTDSLLLFGNENLRVSQIFAGMIFVAGIILTVIFWKNAANRKKNVNSVKSASAAKPVQDAAADSKATDIQPDNKENTDLKDDNTDNGD